MATPEIDGWKAPACDQPWLNSGFMKKPPAKQLPTAIQLFQHHVPMFTFFWGPPLDQDVNQPETFQLAGCIIAQLGQRMSSKGRTECTLTPHIKRTKKCMMNCHRPSTILIHQPFIMATHYCSVPVTFQPRQDQPACRKGSVTKPRASDSNFKQPPVEEITTLFAHCTTPLFISAWKSANHAMKKQDLSLSCINPFNHLGMNPAMHFSIHLARKAWY